MKNEVISFIIGFMLGMLALFWYGNNSAGNEPIKQQFEQVEDNQSTITESINKSENRVEHVESQVNEAGRIIEDCQRILDTVRKRDEEKRKQIENAT